MKTKFQKSLTVNTDTIPAKNIDTLSIKKNYCRYVKACDSTLKNSFDTSINDSAKRISVDTLLFSKDSLDAPVNYTAEDSGVLIIPEKQFILYGKAHTDYKDIKLDANTIRYDQEQNLITAYGGTDTSKRCTESATFAQGDQTSQMDTVLYNLKSQKGITKNTYYKEGETVCKCANCKKS